MAYTKVSWDHFWRALVNNISFEREQVRLSAQQQLILVINIINKLHVHFCQISEPMICAFGGCFGSSLAISTSLASSASFNQHKSCDGCKYHVSSQDHDWHKKRLRQQLCIRLQLQ